MNATVKELWQIFMAFLKPGIFGFGGGQASIPLIEREVVDNYHLVTSNEFADYYAIGNTLPGPIATKMSIIIGYDAHGFLGALVALLGAILPSSIAIIIIFVFFQEFKDTAFVKGMQIAIKPVVVVLIGSVAFGMARTSVFANVDLTSSKTLIVFALFIITTGIILMNELIPGINIHPAIVIVVALLVGGFFIR